MLALDQAPGRLGRCIRDKYPFAIGCSICGRSRVSRGRELMIRRSKAASDACQQRLDFPRSRIDHHEYRFFHSPTVLLDTWDWSRFWMRRKTWSPRAERSIFRIHVGSSIWTRASASIDSDRVATHIYLRSHVRRDWFQFLFYYRFAAVEGGGQGRRTEVDGADDRPAPPIGRAVATVARLRAADARKRAAPLTQLKSNGFACYRRSSPGANRKLKSTGRSGDGGSGCLLSPDTAHRFHPFRASRTRSVVSLARVH